MTQSWPLVFPRAARLLSVVSGFSFIGGKPRVPWAAPAFRAVFYARDDSCIRTSPRAFRCNVFATAWHWLAWTHQRQPLRLQWLFSALAQGFYMMSARLRLAEIN
jgi:hypothetical protein